MRNKKQEEDEKQIFALQFNETNMTVQVGRPARRVVLCVQSGEKCSTVTFAKGGWNKRGMKKQERHNIVK